jgi:hypothetical protein
MRVLTDPSSQGDSICGCSLVKMHSVLPDHDMSNETVCLPWISLNVASYSYSLCLLIVVFVPAFFDENMCWNREIMPDENKGCSPHAFL